MTLSRDFLLSRGECCGLGCKNCPYTKPRKKGNKNVESVCNDFCGQIKVDQLERGAEVSKDQLEKADKKV